MSNYLGIELAITNSLEANLLAYPKEWPNHNLGKDKPDGMWYAVHNLRAESTPATIGINGEDNHPGIIQIDVNYPSQRGSNAVLTEIDRLCALYKSGTKLDHLGQTVHIMSTSVSPGRTVGGFYRVSLSLTYFSRTNR